jgi:NTP pyrophosphatase (non-canonical NTP hydrolase)
MPSKYIPQITQEECAEVTQAIAKVFRFGIEQVHPETQVSNGQHLAEEIGQLQRMLELLISEWNLDQDVVSAAYYNKLESLFNYSVYEV